MRLNRLEVTNVRNLTHAVITPSPALTVLCGANGQGKTNLLEAIWLLTGGKSFRGSKDAELIRHGEKFGVLEAAFTAGERDQTMRLTIGGKESQRPGRNVKLNDVDRGRAARIAGTFTAVVFEPDHLGLVKSGPEGRRKFLDAALCQLYPGYLAALRRYTRIVTQKNALLKNYEETPGADLLLDTFNGELCKTGGELMLRRKEYMDTLSPIARQNYDELSSGAEKLTLLYQSAVPCGADGQFDLAPKLDEMRRTELRAGFCLVGPHKEDIEILINGRSGKAFGSQGQQRSAVLSMKLAEATVAGNVLEEHPVMLLDDVLSELDDTRQTYLLTRIEDKQTIVTTCDTAAFARTNGKIVMVNDGEVKE